MIGFREFDGQLIGQDEGTTVEITVSKPEPGTIRLVLTVEMSAAAELAGLPVMIAQAAGAAEPMLLGAG